MHSRDKSLLTQYFLYTCLLVVAVGLAGYDSAIGAEADSAGDSSMFVVGPTMGDMGSLAEIMVPDGFAFTGKEGTMAILESTHNLASGNELGVLVPVEGSWWALFEYDDCGYVQDEEGAELDADAILSSLRESTEEGNKERAKRGWDELVILGWAEPPHYDKETHSLDWGTQLRGTDSSITVNYNTRRLGRLGVMHITLIAEPDSLATLLPTFKSVLNGFQFKAGRRYAEFKEGDKLAEYGLTALIVGGGAAVAAKSGAFKWLWKVLVMGGAAAAGAAKKFFGKKDSGAKQPPSYPGT